jgi:hypothetical protein
MGMMSAPVEYDCWRGCWRIVGSEEDETTPSELSGVRDPSDWISGEFILIESSDISESSEALKSTFEETLVES